MKNNCFYLLFVVVFFVVLEKDMIGVTDEIPKSFIAQFLPKNPIIVEAGANDGTDTTKMSRMWPQGIIYAFEPIPSIFEQLSVATRSMRNVTCYRLALGPVTGSAKFYVSSGTSDQSSSLLAPKEHIAFHPTVYFNSTIDVEVMTLDDWANKYGITRIDFMWLDMQGSELDMLKASPRLLKTLRAIYTEVSLVELYKGTPLYDEVKAWLELQGFCAVREEIPWKEGGNVLFVRDSILKS